MNLKHESIEKILQDCRKIEEIRKDMEIELASFHKDVKQLKQRRNAYAKLLRDNKKKGDRFPGFIMAIL